MIWFDDVETEVRILLRWLKLWKNENSKELWYRDAKEHIEKIADLVGLKHD